MKQFANGQRITNISLCSDGLSMPAPLKQRAFKDLTTDVGSQKLLGVQTRIHARHNRSRPRRRYGLAAVLESRSEVRVRCLHRLSLRHLRSRACHTGQDGPSRHCHSRACCMRGLVCDDAAGACGHFFEGNEDKQLTTKAALVTKYELLQSTVRVPLASIATAVP